MRVGVWLGHATMCRPAGMADAGMTIDFFVFGGFFHQCHTTNTTHTANPCFGLHGDA